MKNNLNFSIIVPVYNRPDELLELLESLDKQTNKDFELVIVEDGSQISSKEICDQFSQSINISYYYKENQGPAIARNYGLSKAKGNYFLFFDSDCIIPPHYFEELYKELSENFVDCFGGPDGASKNFSDFQKAVSYAMTSFFTTGGIRGGDKQIQKFYPRSFNLGFSKKVYDELGGFPITRMHPGEDMVLAIEIIDRGFETKLLNNLYVFHKRRISFSKFYLQVYRFGKTRYYISQIYPHTFKPIFALPSLFLIGLIALLILSIFKPVFIAPLALYSILIFVDSLLESASLQVALISVASSITQICGYGIGFLRAFYRHKLGKDEYGVLKTGFYNKE
ncbi:MAG: glycosyltransferase [Marinifilaceae bacterium]|jgi:glycosyltransferase involved in cell wall biosynthesis|nr:glycosyltransferase [Marinifilaceae bacterium]